MFRDSNFFISLGLGSSSSLKSTNWSFVHFMLQCGTTAARQRRRSMMESVGKGGKYEIWNMKKKKRLLKKNMNNASIIIKRCTRDYDVLFQMFRGFLFHIVTGKGTAPRSSKNLMLENKSRKTFFVSPQRSREFVYFWVWKLLLPTLDDCCLCSLRRNGGKCEFPAKFLQQLTFRLFVASTHPACVNWMFCAGVSHILLNCKLHNNSNCHDGNS